VRRLRSPSADPAPRQPAQSLQPVLALPAGPLNSFLRSFFEEHKIL
jgi:hypothetical protein